MLLNLEQHRRGRVKLSSFFPSTLVEAGDGLKVDRSLECKGLVAAHLPACELGLFVTDDDGLIKRRTR